LENNRFPFWTDRSDRNSCKKPTSCISEIGKGTYIVCSTTARNVRSEFFTDRRAGSPPRSPFVSCPLSVVRCPLSGEFSPTTLVCALLMSGAWDSAHPTIGSKHRRLPLTSSPPAGRCARNPIPSPGRTGPRFVSRCISQPRLHRGSCTVGVRTNAMCPVFRPVGFDREGKDRPCVFGSNRPLQAHPISLRCRPRPGWATSSSAKGTDGTGTAAGR
jgi:hypothetical protein